MNIRVFDLMRCIFAQTVLENSVGISITADDDIKSIGETRRCQESVYIIFSAGDLFFEENAEFRNFAFQLSNHTDKLTDLIVYRLDNL